MVMMSFGNDQYSLNDQSSLVIKHQTFHALLQIEEIEVVECHQVTVASENKHLVLVYCHRLAVSRAGLLSDYETMSIVVNYFLANFVLVLLLNSYVYSEIPMV
jgi:hypothetical protein